MAHGSFWLQTDAIWSVDLIFATVCETLQEETP